MTTNQGDPPVPRKRRSAREQLGRSSMVMHASWMAGLAVLLGAGITAGGFSVAGVLFLLVLFLPVFVAYRRDRLSFPIIFGTLFLPTWPWALYQAASRKPRVLPVRP